MLVDLRAALADTLNATVPVDVHPFPVPNLNDAGVIVMGFPMEPVTFDEWKVTATLVAAVRQTPELGALLDHLIDPTHPESIQAALAADRTLGGVVSSAAVLAVGDYELTDLGGVGYVSAPVTVDIIA